MVSENTFITLLVITSFVLAFLIIYLARNLFSDKIKLIKGLVVIVIIFCAVGFFTKTDVYIFGETSTKTDYSQQVVLYPTDIQLPNGKVVTVSPLFSIDKSIVVNLSKVPLYFEKVRYGSTNERVVKQKLSSYQVTKVEHTIDYIFVEPPAYINVKGSGTTKGWIHY